MWTRSADWFAPRIAATRQYRTQRTCRSLARYDEGVTGTLARPRGLFVSDLDGTFFDDQGRVPPENLAAVARAYDAGVAFAIATGRRRSTFRRVRERLDGLPFRTSLSNGAVLLAPDNERFEQVLTIPWSGILALAERRHPAVKYLVAITAPPEPAPGAAEEADSFVLTPDGGFHHAESPWDAATYVAVDPEHARSRTLIHAALVLDGREESERLESMAADCCGEGVTIHSVRSPVGRGVLLEVVVEGGKGRALRELAATLGVPLAATAGIGDEVNDRSLLEAAGHPYVVGGSFLASLGMTGTVVRTSSHGAVADAIDRFLETLEHGAERPGLPARG